MSEPSASGRLHPSSIFFRIVPHARALILPGLIVLLFSHKESWELWLMLMFVPSTIYELGQYFTLRYSLGPEELVVRSGLIWKRERHIPVERIHGIDLTQGPLHRLFGVADARIETAGGNEPEAVLRVLSLQALEKLRTGVAGARHASAEIGGGDAEAPVTEQPAPQEEVLLRLGTAELIKLGLVSLRGAAAALIVVGLAWEFDLFDRLDIRQQFRALAAWEGSVWMLVAAALAIVGLPALLLVVSIVWTLVRLYDFRLADRGEDLRLSCGLLTRVHATIPRRHIQLVSMISSPVHRLFGRVSIRVETASGSAQQEEKKVIGQKWFIPLLPTEQAGATLVRVTGRAVDPGSLEWRPLSARAFRRRAKLALLGAATMTVVVLLFVRPWGAASFVVFVPLMLWHARADLRRTGYALFDGGVAFRSGVLTRRLSLTFFDRVQVVSLEESPFDRWTRMATVDVDTAGAGAAEHRVRVPYLDREAARDLYLAVSAASIRAAPAGRLSRGPATL